jgi:hypothetical protein
MSTDRSPLSGPQLRSAKIRLAEVPGGSIVLITAVADPSDAEFIGLLALVIDDYFFHDGNRRLQFLDSGSCAWVDEGAEVVECS